jgi:hypothetical protein
MLECQTLFLTDVETSAWASLEPASPPVTNLDEASMDSKLLLSENEPSLSFECCWVPTISEVATDIPSPFVNLFSATTGWAYCAVSKPVEVSLTAFSSVAFGADGTDVEVLFPERDLVLGWNLPPALAAEEFKANLSKCLFYRKKLFICNKLNVVCQYNLHLLARGSIISSYNGSKSNPKESSLSSATSPAWIDGAASEPVELSVGSGKMSAEGSTSNSGESA